MLRNCSESALKLLWNCSETNLQLICNCSEIAPKLLWKCSESALGKARQEGVPAEAQTRNSRPKNTGQVNLIISFSILSFSSAAGSSGRKTTLFNSFQLSLSLSLFVGHDEVNRPLTNPYTHLTIYLFIHLFTDSTARKKSTFPHPKNIVNWISFITKSVHTLSNSSNNQYHIISNSNHQLFLNWKSETAPKLLWNCSETALGFFLFWLIELNYSCDENPKLLWNCSETAPKLLWNCSETIFCFN